MMKGLVLESNRQLRRLRELQKTQLTLFDSVRRHGSAASRKYVPAERRIGLAKERSSYGPPTVGFRFEPPPDDLSDDDGDMDELNATLDADLPDDPLLKHMAAGKISFGDVDNMSTTLDYRGMAAIACDDSELSVEQTTEHARKCLLLAWGLAASHVGLWTADHETVVLNIIHNVVRVFTSMLHVTVATETSAQSGGTTTHDGSGHKRQLSQVLQVLAGMVQVLYLDAVYKHLQVAALRLAHDTVEMLLSNKYLPRSEPRQRTFHGAYVLLKFFETYLQQIYIDMPRSPMAAVHNGRYVFGHDIYQCGVRCKLVHPWPDQEETSVSQVAAVDSPMVSEEHAAAPTNVTDAAEEDITAAEQNRSIRSENNERNEIVGCEISPYKK